MPSFFQAWRRRQAELQPAEWPEDREGARPAGDGLPKALRSRATRRPHSHGRRRLRRRRPWTTPTAEHKPQRSARAPAVRVTRDKRRTQTPRESAAFVRLEKRAHVAAALRECRLCLRENVV